MDVPLPPDAILDAIRIATDGLDPIGHHKSALTYLFESICSKLTCHAFTTNSAALFIGKNDYLERMIRCNLIFIEYFNDFQGANRSKGAIVIATIRHHIDV